MAQWMQQSFMNPHLPTYATGARRIIYLDSARWIIFYSWRSFYTGCCIRHSSKTWGVTNNLGWSTIIVTVKPGFLCWGTRRLAFFPALGTAIRHHQEQELEALSNTVLNMALLNAPNADIQRMFLNWLNEFTSWHLMLLRYLHEGTYNASQRQIWKPNDRIFSTWA